MTVIENFDGKQLMYGVAMSKEQKIKSIEIRDDKIVSIDEFGDGAMMGWGDGLM